MTDSATVAIHMAGVFALIAINITVLIGGRIALLEILFGVITPITAFALTEAPSYPWLNFLVVITGLILLYDSLSYTTGGM